MRKTIPFVPLPLKTAKRVTKPFYGIGDRLSRLFPGLDVKLKQAELDFVPREYLTIATFSSLFWIALMYGSFWSLSLFVKLPERFLTIIAPISLVMGAVSFLYILLTPQLTVSRKVRDLERNLLFALRHLLIQVKSGVSLFDAMVSVSKQSYGLISEEFGECVGKISTGLPETMALEELALKNPSLHFRRVIWQLTNAIRSGVDLGSMLDNIVNAMANEQKVAIRKYGSQLNPMAMMYMITAVIMPSLGITFLIILSSFTGLFVSKVAFFFILGALIVFQFSFVGIIKSRRPAVEL